MDDILLHRYRESMGHSGDLFFLQGDHGSFSPVESYGYSDGA